MQSSNRITQLYEDKTLLITGGTGFLGKVLVEKLLRVCTKIRKIYIIVRPKNGKTCSERLKGIFNGPLFESVRNLHGAKIFDKVEAIPGDLSAPGLALSPGDRQKLADEVQIVFHSGASVRFDEPFKNAVLLNVRGTKMMLELAKECKELLVFCHISTAYCHEDQEVVHDELYPAPTDPHKVIRMCERMENEELERVSREVRGCRANNYTFTKALGEALAEEAMGELPVVIQRPSAVIPVWKEPLPGWTDNINGPMGLLIGAGKGVIRTMHGRGDYFIDYLPVDVVANGLICTTYDYLTVGTRRIYNLTSSDEIRITFQEIMDIGRNIVTTKVPFSTVLWYPGGSMKSSRLLHQVCYVLFQLVPAFFVDLLLVLLGYKPFLVRVQKRIWRGYDILEYYTNRQWTFKKKNSEMARCLMNEEEKRVFKVDGHGLDIENYFTDCITGARRYLLKEKDEDIPAALKRIKMLWMADVISKVVIVVGLFYFLYNKLF